MISSTTPYKLAEIIRDTWYNLYTPTKYNQIHKELKLRGNQKMNKYNTEDYFSVIETKTGRKIVDCGDEQDALLMISFDPANRTYTRNKFLMGNVIDIEMPKQLPTTNISVFNYQKYEYAPRQEQLGQIKLPDRQQAPFRV